MAAGSLPPDSGKNEPYERLGHTFDTEPEFYDRFRPGYADNAFGRIIELTTLSDDARVLEIGSGAGQATLPMAERGYDLTAIEPGTNLADLTRKKLRPFPNARVITDKFEDVELPNESFDLIYSAMALHWVPEKMRFTKPHQLLKPGGYLAVLSNEIVTDGAGDKFYRALLSIDRPGWQLEPMPDTARLPTPEELYHQKKRTPIDDELFEEIDHAVFAFDEPSPRTGLQHIAYMHTLATVLAMPEVERMAFLEEVKTLIETKFNNQLDYRYATTLVIARKK